MSISNSLCDSKLMKDYKTSLKTVINVIKIEKSIILKYDIYISILKR